MGTPFNETTDRMLYAGRLKNISALARVLNITPQALSNYKKRGHMPTDLVVKFAEIYNLSVDWLLTGEGNGQPQQKLPEIADLEPDELVCVGKTLQILRGGNRIAAEAFRQSVDAFLNLSPRAEAV